MAMYLAEAFHRARPFVCSIETNSFTFKRTNPGKVGLEQQREALFAVQRHHQGLPSIVKSSHAPKTSDPWGFAAAGLYAGPEAVAYRRRHASKMCFTSAVEVEESQNSTAALLPQSRPETPKGLGGIVRGARGFFQSMRFRRDHYL